MIWQVSMLEVQIHFTEKSQQGTCSNLLLFIEEKGEDLYRIDRMLTHLRLSGVLEELEGLVAGSFQDCGDRASIDRLLLDTVSGLNIPLVTGLPVGHGLINVSLPIGLQAAIDADKMTLQILEPCVTS